MRQLQCNADDTADALHGKALRQPPQNPLAYTSLSNDLDEHPLAAPAVELGVEELLPGAEMQPPAGNGLNEKREAITRTASRFSLLGFAVLRLAVA
jgi:hypothetical protein